jgi:signal peptidase I
VEQIPRFKATGPFKVPPKPQPKSVFREYSESFIIAIVLALVVRTFFLQAFKIPTGSMRPTLVEGDRILVNKVVYGIRIPFLDWRLPSVKDPRRGDLVVFRSLDNPKRDFIKRLVALGEEEVEIRDLRLWIDGKPLDDPPVFQQRLYYNRGPFGQRNKSVHIPEQHYFFLGDNSASSRDSRYWGFMPRKNLVGRAFLIYWPPKRIRWLH